MSFFLIFLGAGIGGVGRHGVNLLAMRMFGPGLPVGTVLVNVLGSLVMGLIAGWLAARPHLPQEVRLFLTTGVLGGFTTFSAFSLDAALLIGRGRWCAAAFYVIASVTLSIAALFAGLAAARAAGRVLG